jgi:hypothetical protein
LPLMWYQAGLGDRAEDISFSRWSPIDWGDADSSPTDQNRPVKQSPAAGYRECSADRAEDISFSRWSPTDWGNPDSSPTHPASGTVEQLPAAAYSECPADKAEDISFSRWSPVDWEADSMLSSDEGGAHGGDGEYRLLCISSAGGEADR